MKNLIIFILSFFAYLSGFAQDMTEKRFFEDNPKLGGDVVIKSSSVKVENDEIHKIFEIESLGEGAYYMDAWIAAPFTKDGYPEYQVAVNGVLTGFTFKPQTDGWHSLALTDAKKSNAAIALWGVKSTLPNGQISHNFRHASVRKNTVNPNPHGFEWESKCGNLSRIMHTRDAVSGGVDMWNYGSILYYYRPKSGIVNFSPPATSANQESSFSVSDLNRVVTLKNQISTVVLSGFEEKYRAWEKIWSRPELAIQSNPYLYALSTEYESLLKYCTKYGKAIWPLLIDKLAQGDLFIVNLLKDITYGGKRSFTDDIMPAVPVEISI
ncbi:MAG: hypothetical protein FWF53_01990 [Candidatus Azobacteroides sp.]|nr:hypothetical protein [Candidatus Azobacteroides sp.]